MATLRRIPPAAIWWDEGSVASEQLRLSAAPLVLDYGAVRKAPPSGPQGQAPGAAWWESTFAKPHAAVDFEFHQVARMLPCLSPITP